MIPELVAHRGASAEAPENTLDAIQLAWDQGADAAEIDIQLTRDGQLVAIHDETTERTCGLDWLVAERSLAELKTLDAGAWKSTRFANERIPTLAEVLEIVPPGKRLFIELKCDVTAISELHRVLNDLKTSREQTVLIGLDFDTIVAAKRTFPDRTALWVTEQTGDELNREQALCPTTQHLVEQALAVGLDGLDLNDCLERPVRDISVIRQAGLKSCVWTVNSPERARWWCDEGIDSITTDVPRLLRQMLAH